MTPAAFRYLRAIVNERAASPMIIARYVPGDLPSLAFLAALRSLSSGFCTVMPVGCRIDFIKPRGVVTVVTGKGKRRRGVAP